MPTYEYHCDGCEHHFDEFQSILDKPLKKCPKCRKPKLRRIFGTGAAVLFKGSGFHETDYRSESYKAGAKADAEAAKPPGDGKGDAKSETKSETKTDAKPAAIKGTKAKAAKDG